ncbi:MAG: hypothetical protein V3V05_11920 [Pontiella sp.]
MKALSTLKQKTIAYALIAVVGSFFMGIAHAETRYVDICGLVTVNGEPEAGVYIAAWPCPTGGVPVVETVSTEVMTNGYNYHIVHVEGEFNPWVPLPVSLSFTFGECTVVKTCEEIAALYEIDDKPIINIDIPCGPKGGGGHTPGFWQNKNGQALISSDDIALLNECCLADDDGYIGDFTNKGKFKTWIKKRRAKNMAYQLSGHLAAMKMNVSEGFVDGGALVYMSGGDTISIDDLIVEANDALCADGYTPKGDANRDYQGWLKDGLDAANNNINWVNP